LTPLTLQGLNRQQKLAVKYIGGPQLIVAGPGSGKTRVLTHKIAFLIKEKGVDARNILAVTFTNKAANEMKERVVTLLNQKSLGNLWLGTFHKVCARILRIDGKYVGIPPQFTIYDNNDSKALIKKIIKKLGYLEKDLNSTGALSAISNAKAELILPKSYKNFAFAGSFSEKIEKVYNQYQKELEKAESLDFDDLILEVVRLFKKNPGILEKWQSKFVHILIDEYQDTNKAQYIFIKLLASKNRNLYVVGDVSQSIYSFRGADYRNILSFEKSYPNCKIFRLEKNYRSTQNILDAAKAVIENNSTHIRLDLFADKKMGEKIKLYQASSEVDEALYVVKGIKDGIAKDAKYSNFAVLYRTNAQSRVIEEELIKQGIPYKLIGGTRFYDRREIKDALGFLRILHNPKDAVSWERIINVPPRGIGPKTLEDIRNKNFDVDYIDKSTRFPIKKMREAKKKMELPELLDFVLNITGYYKWLEGAGEESIFRAENLKELKSVATKFGDLSEFLENVSLVNPQDLPSGNKKAIVSESLDAVSLMTIHQAKGLEFLAVYIIGMEEGLFPHSRSLTDRNEVEEERRLCYVGITRAIENLYLVYASTRLYFGAFGKGEVSRFIGEIPKNLIEFINGAAKKLDFLDEDRSDFDW